MRSEVPGSLDLLDFVVGEYSKSGATAERLAFLLDISRSHASSLLSSLPASLVKIKRRSREVLFLPRNEPSNEGIAAAKERFRRFSKMRRSGRKYRVAAAREAIDRATDALRSGRFAILAQIMRDPWLDAGVLARSVSTTYRDDLVFHLGLLKADAAMQRGNHFIARSIVNRLLSKESNKRNKAAALAILGAALRMEPSPDALRDSVAAYEETLATAEAVSSEEASVLRANVHAAIVAPHLVLGNLDEARRHAHLAGDIADSSWPERQMEAEHRLALVEFVSGHANKARARLEKIVGAGSLPLWLQGWRARYLPMLFHDTVDSGVWSEWMLNAWNANAGFGFQRLLIAAQIAHRSTKFEPDVWPLQVRSAVSRLVNSEHVRIHGTNIRDCRTCSGHALPIVIAHSIGCSPGQLQWHLTT